MLMLDQTINELISETKLYFDLLYGTIVGAYVSW